MDQKERNIIKTPELEIDGNVMRYESSVIQMSNVTRCEAAPMPQKPYPTWAIVGAILGFLIMITGAVLVAICAIAVFCAILVWISYKNQDLGTYLIFELNSGKVLLFSCQSKVFLEEAQKAVVDCFNDRGVSYAINFQNCTISNSQVGEHNEVHK